MATVTEAALKAQFDAIKNEVAVGGNTKQRVYDALNNLYDTVKAAIPTEAGGGSYTDAMAVSANADYHPEAFTSLTPATTTTWATNGKFINNKKITLTMNITLDITGVTNGAEGSLVVTQDNTGNRIIALPAGSLPSTVALNSAANAKTFLGWKYDGVNFFWTAKNY